MRKDTKISIKPVSPPKSGVKPKRSPEKTSQKKQKPRAVPSPPIRSPPRSPPLRSKAKQNSQQESLMKKRSKSTHNASTQSVLYKLSSSQQEDDIEKDVEKRKLELTEKQAKMYSCIQIFNLLQSNEMQLRCITHNNTLTLYCLTERKVLCVNCIYGVTRHRTHKVLPLRDCMEEVMQDNIELKKLLQDDLKGLEDTVRISQENIQRIEREMKAVLNEIDLSFKRDSDELKLKYERRRSQALSVYQPIQEKFKALEKGVEQFKFKAWETLSKLGLGRRQETASNDAEVICQVFCVALADLTRLTTKPITSRQLDRLHKKLGRFEA